MNGNYENKLAQKLTVAAQSGNAALVKRLLRKELSSEVKARAASLAFGAIDALENPILAADWIWRHTPYKAESKRPGKRMVHAVWQRISGTMKLLLNAGAKPNTVDAEGCSLLCKIVCRKKLADIFQRLLSAGADPNSDDGTGASALYLAAIHGNEEYVQLLLEFGADPDKGYKDFTPLLFAAKNQQLDILRCLLSAGANINHRDTKGRSALMHAMYRHGDFPFLVMYQWASDAEELQNPKDLSSGIIRLLIKSGIEHAEPDKMGFLAVDYALMASIKGVDLPVELGVNMAHLQLCKAAMEGDSQQMIELLESGEIPARIMSIALQIVAVRGFEGCCKALLENGADANKISIYGISPAQAAVVGLRLPVIRLLVAHGLSKEGLTEALKYNCMALSHYYNETESAFQAKRLELARYLLEQGADPNAHDEENGDLITIATTFEANGDLVRLLLEFGLTP